MTPTNQICLKVNLCGHATLAASHILFSSDLVNNSVIEFVTLSGVLTVKKIPSIDVVGVPNLLNGKAPPVGFYIELDFPAYYPITKLYHDDISIIDEALNGASIIDMKRTEFADDLLVVLTSGKIVLEVQAQFDALAKLSGRGVSVTGIAPPESGFDFYSRFFSPKFGINEVSD
ncbi:putative phenazine biosynthesis PhzF protein [Medicago truncatula]|uniref:Putative phenazine biosynthesis PhzF protein n=1 Tax=Medicago truncatula TaxID=3880 RepID=A0A396JN15_MEDTR|nr:putative phenazine biosynthesis PhzF protein [Medicago truncatula]